MGNFDPGRFLRADRMERMAAMGVPAGGSRNELNCCLCDELDDVQVLRERLRSSLWKGGSRHGRTAPSACAPWSCGDADLLVDLVLDVPSENLPTDLRKWAGRLEGFFEAWDWIRRSSLVEVAKGRH